MKSLLCLALAALAAPAAAGNGPYLIQDLCPTGSSDPEQLTTMAGHLYFVATDCGAHGQELWKLDGPSGQISLVVDLEPGPSSSSIEDLAAINNRLWFYAQVGGQWGLYTSDGTSAGTSLVRQVGSEHGPIARLGSRVFFSHDVPGLGEEPWVSDGGAAGTSLLMDVWPGSNSSILAYTEPCTVGSWVYFQASDPTGGEELWATDGTSPGGTWRIDVVQGNGGSSPNQLFNSGGVLYFTATYPGSGNELWRSGGSSASTFMVRDIRPGAGSSWITDFTTSGGTLFFAADDGTSGYELWKSDGTPVGTVMVKDIRPGPAGGYPNAMADLWGTLLFAGDNGSFGEELWRSDGTTAGTFMVKDINPSGDAWLYWLTAAGSRVYFAADDGSTGQELWSSDGTTAGTVPEGEVNPGPGAGMVGPPFAVGSRLVFPGQDPGSGVELWALDVCELGQPQNYCTAGQTASGCQARISASGLASSSAPAGMLLDVTGVEADKDGMLFFGTNGQQAKPWGNGTSFQCVVPPVQRTGLMTGVGTAGTCTGLFRMDFNTWMWANQGKAPSAGQLVQVQCWFRDPHNTSNQTTSLSDAIEFKVCP